MGFASVISSLLISSFLDYHQRSQTSETFWIYKISFWLNSWLIFCFRTLKSIYSLFTCTSVNITYWLNHLNPLRVCYFIQILWVVVVFLLYAWLLPYKMHKSVWLLYLELSLILSLNNGTIYSIQCVLNIISICMIITLPL